MKSIKSVTYDWFSPNEYKTYHVGGGVEEILYHSPQGDGDRHYCDIHEKGGFVTRVFNLNKVHFFPEEEPK
jgi:hypothetical protein